MLGMTVAVDGGYCIMGTPNDAGDTRGAAVVSHHREGHGCVVACQIAGEM